MTDPSTPAPGGARRRALLAAAALVPLALVATVLLAPAPAGTSASTGAPDIPIAVVNEDMPIETTLGGQQVPVAAGKLLTAQLTTSDDDGLAVTLTDAGTAADGLRSGLFAAVVTIPEGFSADYASLEGAAPTSAALSIQTDQGQSYVASLLARALTADIDSALAQTSTRAFTSATLEGMSALGGELGTAAGGADTLTEATTGIADGIAAAGEGAQELGSGAAALAEALRGLADGTAELPAASAALADGTAVLRDGSELLTADLGLAAGGSELLREDLRGLTDDLAALRAELPTLTPEQVAARLTDLEARGRGAADGTALLAADLALATAGSGALTAAGSGLADAAAALRAVAPSIAAGMNDLADGSALLAQGIEAEAEGLGELAPAAAETAQGSGALAGGLHEAADALPSYTDGQVSALAGVVSAPVVQNTPASTSPAPAGAAGAVLVPLALWLGALGATLVLHGPARRDLLSRASTGGLWWRWLLPVALLGAVQAVPVTLALAIASGLGPRPLVTMAAILAIGVLFAVLVSALAVVLGTLGRILALAAVAVQLIASGALLPAGMLHQGWDSLTGLLPLSGAVDALHHLVSTGSVRAAMPGMLAVLLWAVGVALVALSVFAFRRTVPAAALRTA